MKKLLMISTALALGACSQNWDVEGVQEMDSTGTNFDKNLKNEYVELAIIERTRGDWDEVDRLLTKAISAADGGPASVAEPDASTQSEAAVKDLRQAHKRLMDAYKAGARDKNPEMAAKAQVGYECMTNAYKWDIEEDIKSCRTYFDYAMNNLDGKKQAATKTAARTDEAKAAPTAAVKKAVVSNIPAEKRAAYTENGKSYMLKNGQYLIYYAFGSAAPAQNLDELFKDVIMEYRIANPAKVAVNGYADTAGSTKINEALSLRRAKTVSNALVKSGVDPVKIETKGLGETDLAVPTEDNVAEPRNRRTTIEFKE